MSSNYLLKVLKKYHGLIDVTTKVPVIDKYSLSLVYTPGVGQACLDIKKNLSEVYELTNKGNSLIIITDGTSFPAQTDPTNLHMIPFIEPIAIFYKQIYNIDTYPLILDITKVEKIEDLHDTLYNLAPAYAGFELYGIEPSRVEKLLALWDKKPVDALLLTSLDRVAIEKGISGNEQPDNLKTCTVIAALHRALLDLRVSVRVPPEVIQAYIKAVNAANILNSDNIYAIARALVHIAAKVIIEANIHLIKTNTAEYVKERLEDFYLEGPEAWVTHTALDYVSQYNKLEHNAIELHRAHKGVTCIRPKVEVRDPSFFKQILCLKNQTEVSEQIIKDPHFAYEATCKGNLCAIISNGTAILGFGDIGPEPGLPVMEGKSVLFKQLAGVDVMPICIREKDPPKVIQVISRFSCSFAAINLEDIKAPDCFDIERTLINQLDIPVFHDDQHGTAIVCTAGFLNSLKLLKKKPEEVKVIVNGGGAAGLSITELLVHAGVKKLVVCDTKGAIYKGRKENMNPYKEHIADITNQALEKGDLPEVLKGADFFIGVSVAGAMKAEWIKNMNDKPVIFALANPFPEIYPNEAKAAGAYIVATGRSDFKNQVNNSLVFPGLFRGAIDIRAKKVTLGMKMAAAVGIAGLLKEEDLSPDMIIAGALDTAVSILVARKVAEAGIEENMAQRVVDSDLVAENLKYFHIHGRFNYEKSLTHCTIKNMKSNL